MTKRSIWILIQYALLIVVGLLLAEVYFRIYKGNPPALSYDNTFSYTYLDIYDRFFENDPQGVYHNQRKGSRPGSFGKCKPGTEKRIFILGESVALFFDHEILKNKLHAVLPSYQWNILNCGMCSYDSYRVLLTAKEIVNYEPDLIIVMMGNNEDCHNPVAVNPFMYRHPVLARFWVTRTLFDAPLRKYVAPARRNVYYRENLDRILRLAQGKNIPVVVCSLPNNRKIHLHAKLFGSSGEYFPAWWLLWRQPGQVENAVRSVTRQEDNANWLRAKALEKMGETDKASAYYALNRCNERVARNSMLRYAARDNDAMLFVDFEKRIMDLTNNHPGFDYFCDEVHFWPPVYALLSDDIIETLYQRVTTGGMRIFADSARWNFAGYDRSCPDDVLKSNKIYAARMARGQCDSFPNLEALFSGDDWESSLGARCDVIKYMLKEDPSAVASMNAWFQRTGVAGGENPFLYYLQIGEMLREEKRYEEAMSYFSSAVKYGRDNYAGYLFRGLCYYDLKRRASAKRDFDTLAILKPDYCWLTWGLLDSLCRQ